MESMSPSSSLPRPLAEFSAGFHHFRCSLNGGDSSGFEVFLWKGEQAGSTLLLSAGMRGDEYEGPLFLNSLAREWRPAHLKGTIIIVPVLQEAAFFAGSRQNPHDGEDLAHAFPGDENGSVTKKIAFLFETQFLANSDFYVDIRSAGAEYEAMPWAEYSLSQEESTFAAQRKMARCFPEVWHRGAPASYLRGSVLDAAHQKEIPAVRVQLYGGGTVANKDLRRLNIGFENLLRVCGLVEGATDLNVPFAVYEEEEVYKETEKGRADLPPVQHPAPCDGILASIARLGARVQAGDVLATVRPLDGSAVHEVVAERNGRLVLRRRQRFVKNGVSLGAVVEI